RAVYVKARCEHCGGHLEFSALAIGQTVACPHCRQETKLFPERSLASARSQTRAKSLPVGIPLGPEAKPPLKDPTTKTEVSGVMREQGSIKEADCQEEKRKRPSS